MHCGLADLYGEGKVTVMPAVYLLPLRHPAPVAKQVLQELVG